MAALPRRPRTRPLSRPASLLALMILALLLTGCMRFDSSTTIVSDQQVRSQVDVGISSEIANTYGLGPRTVCAPFTSVLPGGSTAAPYFDGSYLHCRITTQATLAQMQASPNSAMSLTHTNGVYHWAFAPSQASLGGIALPGLNTGIDSVHVSVTFPGRVTQASGDGHVRGRTVTWNVPGDINQTLSATGRDHAGSTLSWLRWLVMMPQALMLLASVVMVTRLERGRRRATSITTSPIAGLAPEPRTRPAPPMDPAPPMNPGPPVHPVPPVHPSPRHETPGAHAWTPGTEPTTPEAGPTTRRPMPPPRPSDPWGGRSPWQRPE